MLPEEMSREMCLQTVSSIVKLKWNVEFLMPECFYLPAVSLCGDWLQNWQSAWERGSASSGKTQTHHLAWPPASGDNTWHLQLLRTFHWLHSFHKICAHPEKHINFTYKDCQNAHHFIWASDSRREVYSAPTLGGLSSDSDREHEEEDGAENDDPEDVATNTSSDSSHGEEDTGTVWLWTEWEYKQSADSNPSVYRGN